MSKYINPEGHYDLCIIDAIIQQFQQPIHFNFL